MSLPQCIGFIMDGNRRWAKERNLPTFEGHRKGLEVFQEAIRFLRDEKIPHGVFYAFSTENWKRSEEEVGYLLDLFSASIQKLGEGAEERSVRIRVIGRREDFSETLQNQIQEVEEKTAEFADTTIWVALSYGGRDEIVSAVNKAIEKGERVTESSFEQLLYTAGMPDPDMVVRTSGEKRLSNFLPWQSTYSEFYFIEKHWPALTKDDFKDILFQYEKRERRKGA